MKKLFLFFILMTSINVFADDKQPVSLLIAEFQNQVKNTIQCIRNDAADLIDMVPFVAFTKDQLPKFYGVAILSSQELNDEATLFCIDNGIFVDVIDVTQTHSVPENIIKPLYLKQDLLKQDLSELKTSNAVLEKDVDFIAKLDDFISLRESQKLNKAKIQTLTVNQVKLKKELSHINLSDSKPKLQARLRELERDIRDLSFVKKR